MGRRTKIKRIEAERIIRNRVDELFCQTNVNERQEIIRFTKMWRKAPAFRHGDISRVLSSELYLLPH